MLNLGESSHGTPTFWTAANVHKAIERVCRYHIVMCCVAEYIDPNFAKQ